MPHDKQPPKIALVTEGTFAALVHAYKASPQFMGYSDATRETWARELDLAARRECLGAVSLDVLRPALVQAHLDGLDGRPGKQATALSAFKAIEKWAVVRDRLPRQITLGVETGKPTGGHLPWPDANVLLAEMKAEPHLARVITPIQPSCDFLCHIAEQDFGAGPTIAGGDYYGR